MIWCFDVHLERRGETWYMYQYMDRKYNTMRNYRYCHYNSFVQRWFLAEPMSYRYSPASYARSKGQIAQHLK